MRLPLWPAHLISLAPHASGGGALDRAINDRMSANICRGRVVGAGLRGLAPFLFPPFCAYGVPMTGCP
jgi:hypothetical protein